MSVAALDVLIVAFRLSDVERGYPSGYLAAEIYRQGMEPDPASWYDWHGNIPVRTKPELICGTCVDDFEYDDGSYAPSLIAIEHGHKDVLQALIQVGAVVAARAPHLVHLAVSSERLGCVKVPVQAGADFSVQDDEGNTPAHLTAQLTVLPNSELLKTIAEAAGDADMRVVNNTGETPSHLAAKLPRSQESDVCTRLRLIGALSSDTALTPLDVDA